MDSKLTLLLVIVVVAGCPCCVLGLLEWSPWGPRSCPELEGWRGREGRRAGPEPGRRVESGSPARAGEAPGSSKPLPLSLIHI